MKATDDEIVNKYISLRASAAHRNLEFNLSLTSIRNLLNAKKCAYTGVELVRGKDNHPHKLTVERLDNDRGYVKGNVIAVAHFINQKRGSLTIEEMKQIVKVLERKQ